MFPLAILDFVARLHPVVVHLPIGILVIAVIFQWMTISNRYLFLQPAVTIALFWGMLGAIIACVSGYLLAQSGEYDQELAGWHQWMGIAVAIFSFILYVLHKFYLRPSIARWLSLVMIIMISITGHLGGTLTHGEGYLTAAFSDDKKETIKPIANVQEAAMYSDIVQPILSAKCYSCHGPSKQKGKLRLDNPESIMKGGEEGKVVIPGKSDESELIKRIFLPIGDDDHMPPSAKPQLTENEVLLLHWWVNTGADFNKKVKDLVPTEKIAPVLQSLQTGSAGQAAQTSEIPGKEVAKANDEVVNRLRSAGVVLIPVAKNSNYLSANFVTANSVSDSILQLLSSLDEQLITLKLDNTAVNDQSLTHIAKCKNLRRLHLNNTNISDAGVLHLAALKELQSLNLVGTKVTTDGVLKLAVLKKLKNLYLYQSAVPASDYAKLKGVMPDVIIDTGKYIVPTLASDTTLIKF